MLGGGKAEPARSSSCSQSQLSLLSKLQLNHLGPSITDQLTEVGARFSSARLGRVPLDSLAHLRYSSCRLDSLARFEGSPRLLGGSATLYDPVSTRHRLSESTRRTCPVGSCFLANCSELDLYRWRIAC